jgi:hypothetical protein
MSYDDYKLFKWNNDNKLYYSTGNIYNNVLLHTGTVIKGEWENSICVTSINSENKIIASSNHFIDGYQWGVEYNTAYKIFDNIVRNYNIIINNTDLNTLDDSKTYFYMIDPFMFSNSGHNLSNMLNNIHYIINNNIKDLLILKGYKQTHNFKLLTILLPVDCVIHELDINKVYKITKVIIIPQEIGYIELHKYLITKLRETIIRDYSHIYNDCHNKNIILIKSNRNLNVMLSATQLNCENMLSHLENKDFIYIIPENINIFQLCIYLLFANKIVSSAGSILYTNHIFYNNSAKSIYLYNIVYEEHYSKLINNTLPIFVSNLNINDQTIYLDIIKQIDNHEIKCAHFIKINGF